MKTIAKDPLLAIARVALIIVQGASVFAAAVCAISVPLMLIFRVRVETVMISNGVASDAFWALAIIVALAGIAVAMTFFVARLLSRIVATVGEGDPFVPENAERLSRMAWLTLAIQLIGIPIGAIAIWIENMAEGGSTSDGGFSVSALLLVLVLFILARVFRKGTEMREELAGTV